MTMTSDATTPPEHQHDGATIDISDEVDRLENRETEPSTEIAPVGICVTFQERISNGNNNRVTGILREGDETTHEHAGSAAPENGEDEPDSVSPEKGFIVGYFCDYLYDKNMRIYDSDNEVKSPRLNEYLEWLEHTGRFIPVDRNQEILARIRKEAIVNSITGRDLPKGRIQNRAKSEDKPDSEENPDTIRDFPVALYGNNNFFVRYIIDHLNNAPEGTKLFSDETNDRNIEDICKSHLSPCSSSDQKGSEKNTKKEVIISWIMMQEAKNQQYIKLTDFSFPIFSEIYCDINDNIARLLFRKDRYEEELKLLEQKKPRKYRKRDELPFPELGPRHSKNRNTSQLGLTISPTHKKLFERCAEHFPSNRKAAEEAIEGLAEKLGVEFEP